MKIESFTKIIHHDGTFHLEDNPQYVDIENLNKYKKNELLMISREYGKWLSGSGWTKVKIISAILKDVNVVNKIKSTNRDIKLKSIGICYTELLNKERSLERWLKEKLKT